MGNARVVHVELDVGVDEVGLDRRKVGAYNLSRRFPTSYERLPTYNLALRELVTHLHGPPARAGRDVEHLVRRVLLREGRQVAPLAEHDLDDVVLDV